MVATKVKRALNSNIPRANSQDIRIFDKVLVYREEPKACQGPFNVLDVSEKTVYVDVKGRTVQF